MQKLETNSLLSKLTPWIPISLDTPDTRVAISGDGFVHVVYQGIYLGSYIESTKDYHKFPQYEVYDFKGDYRYLILQPEFIYKSMVQFLLKEAEEWATRKTT